MAEYLELGGGIAVAINKKTSPKMVVGHIKRTIKGLAIFQGNLAMQDAIAEAEKWDEALELAYKLERTVMKLLRHPDDCLCGGCYDATITRQLEERGALDVEH